MTEEITFAYIARRACGCVPMITIDNPEHKKDVAREIAKAVRDGMAVERLPLEEARPRFGRCPDHRPANSPL